MFSHVDSVEITQFQWGTDNIILVKTSDLINTNKKLNHVTYIHVLSINFTTNPHKVICSHNTEISRNP